MLTPTPFALSKKIGRLFTTPKKLNNHPVGSDPLYIMFGFLISNVMPIVYRQSVKHSHLPIPVTISHVSSIAFTGVIFGPALVGFSAETFGLTFNMYLLGIIMFAISVLMLFIMQNDDQDKNIKSDII